MNIQQVICNNGLYCMFNDWSLVCYVWLILNFILPKHYFGGFGDMQGGPLLNVWHIFGGYVGCLFSCNLLMCLSTCFWSDFITQNKGVFLEVTNLVARWNTDLSRHLEKAKANPKGYPSYTSPPSQNEMIKSYAAVVRQSLVQEILKAVFFAVCLDTTPDAGKNGSTFSCDPICERGWRSNWGITWNVSPACPCIPILSLSFAFQ